MFNKFIKTIFLKEKKYFFFVFFAILLSLFSYLLGNNVVVGVKNYLREEIKPIVGADIVLSSDNKIDLIFLEEYIDLFEKTETIELNSTIFDSQNNPILYEFIYHRENYPFYDAFSYDIINSDGYLVTDKETYENFGDYLNIFDEEIKIKGIITKTPLGDLSIYANNKKVYIPIDFFDDSLDSTNSRIDYKVFLNFSGDYSENIVSQVKELSREKGLRVRTISDRQDAIGDITDRFYVFINFFNLIIFILTFFIVILSLESFFKKNKSNFGLLNIFGFTKTKIFLYSFLSLFIVFLVAFLFSILLNYLILSYLSREFEFLGIYLESIIKGFFILIILLFVGLFSPLFKIKKSHIGDLLKDSSDFSNFGKKDYFLYIFLISFGFFFINLVSGISFFYSFIYTFFIIFFIVLFYIIIRKLLLFLYEKLFKKAKNFYIFDSIRSTIKPGNVSFLIVFSSIISFFSIFVFFVFSGSFLNYLNNITKESNDMFVLNVQNEDIQIVEKYLNKDEIYEIISLRISEINGKSLEEFLGTQNVGREFTREFSSTTNFLDNRIVSGVNLAPNGVSVDEEFAGRLGLKLGDKIKFLVAGLEKELEVINFREAIRSGTNPFFFFMLDKSDFEFFPKTYILSYKQSEKIENLEFILSSELNSNLTFINTKDIVDIVIDISNKILKVIYFSLFYIFIFSFLSFIVSILFLKSFKDYKIKILNILGGKLKFLKLGVKFEYFYLILIGFIFSIVFGTILLFVIFSFIDYFSISIFYYFYSFFIVLFIFLFLNLFLYFYSE